VQVLLPVVKNLRSKNANKLVKMKENKQSNNKLLPQPKSFLIVNQAVL